MTASPLSVAHLALAVAVMAVWGTNFVVSKHALGDLPPLLFATLRYCCVLFPALLFVPRPAARWTNLAAYGVLIGVGQFGLLFIALRQSISPGIASLVMQTQVVFTIGLAAVFGGERPAPAQYAGLFLAGAGLATIMIYTNGSITPVGLALSLTAAFCWAAGNIVARRAGRVDMLGYVVWASIFAVPPLFILSWLVEGPSAMAAGVTHAGWVTWAAVVWQAVGNTMFGYGVWGWLLARYPAATVAPLALLVPVFGMTSAALLLGESLPAWKLGAAALVMSGLVLGLFWPRVRNRYGRGMGEAA